MEQDFTISTGTKIFYGLLGLAAIIFAFVLMDLRKADDPEGLILIPLILLVIGVLIFANIVRRKVIIYDDSILVVSLFAEKELDFKDVRGCRVEQKYIVIEPVSPDYPRIMIGNYIDFGNSIQLRTLIQEKFHDLDSQDLEAERNEFMANAGWGVTQEDRQAALKKAKTTAIIYSIGGWVVFAVTLISDVKTWVIVTMLYPFIGLALMWYSKGIIKFITNVKTSVYPHIAVGLMPVILLPGIRGISLYESLDASKIWLPAIFLSVLMFAAIYFSDRVKFVEPVKGKLVIMLVLSTIYGFGISWDSNCYFDDSQPKVYQTIVLDHRIDHGKSTTYYITIAPWGPEQDEKEIDAGSWMYHHAPIGDTVRVKLRPGLLHIPWYIVTKQR